MKNVELESGLLSAILSRPELFTELAERLHTDLFHAPFNRAVYEEMASLYQGRGEISRTKLLQYIQQNHPDQRDLFLENPYILPAETADIVSSLENHHNQRSLASTLNRALEVVRDENLSITGRNSQVQDLVFETTSQFADAGRVIFTSEDVAIECLKLLCDRQKGKVEERIRTGILSFDSYLSGGLRRKNLSVLAGGTSMGKTSFALNIVRNILETGEVPIYFISLEMSKEELVDRLLIQRSKVSADLYNRVNDDGRKALPERAENAIEVARNWIHDKRLLVTDNRGLNIREIKTLCRKARNIFRDEMGLIVIDYLSEIDMDYSQNRNMVKVFGDTVREIRELSKELDCHVLLLHQISREYQKRNNKRPIKSDLRDSGEIEEKADNVFFIHRPAYFQYQHCEEDEPLVQWDAEFIIAKQRGGKTGLIKFVWYPEIQFWQEGSSFYTEGEINYLGREDS